MPNWPLLRTASSSVHKMLMNLRDEVDTAAAEAGIEPVTVDLVRIRVSQLDGCAAGLRQHVQSALARGEDTDRIMVLSAWRDTSYFDDGERAALEIAEDTVCSRDLAAPAPDIAPLPTLPPHQAAAIRWLAVVASTINRLAVDGPAGEADSAALTWPSSHALSTAHCGSQSPCEQPTLDSVDAPTLKWPFF